MPTFLNVISRSSGIIQGQTGKHWSMDMKLDRWRKVLIPTVWRSFQCHHGSLKVNWVNIGEWIANLKWINIGLWTWNSVGGVDSWCPNIWRSFRGHLESCKVKWVNIGVWTWNLIGGAKFWYQQFEGHFNVIMGHWRSTGLTSVNESQIQESR